MPILGEIGCKSQKVRTITSCDVDNSCRKVLTTTADCYRSEHVSGALQDRITTKALHKLEEIKLTTMAELQHALDGSASLSACIPR